LKPILFYSAGSTAACRFAGEYLGRAGIPMIDHPAPEITHLLLDVPSFGPDGHLRGGADIEPLLQMLPAGICIVGGNLTHPALAGYETRDLLQVDSYVSYNAALTAECALRQAAGHLDAAFSDTPAVVIGWGRIGKCLVKQLEALGCDVTVAARKERDRAMLRALGYSAAAMEDLPRLANRTGLLFNTAPELVLDEAQMAAWNRCLAIDLASRKGLLGKNVLWARGLPGVVVPRSSGKLIAKTILQEGFL